MPRAPSSPSTSRCRPAVVFDENPPWACAAALGYSGLCLIGGTWQLIAAASMGTRISLVSGEAAQQYAALTSILLVVVGWVKYPFVNRWARRSHRKTGGVLQPMTGFLWICLLRLPLFCLVLAAVVAQLFRLPGLQGRPPFPDAALLLTVPLAWRLFPWRWSRSGTKASPARPLCGLAPDVHPRP